jgi:tetratricopeptide (TPR) repeat protein
LEESAERTSNAARDAEAKTRSQANAQLADLKGVVPGLIQMQHLHGANEQQVTKARELLKESAIRMKTLLESFPEDADGYLLLGEALRELQEPRAVWAYEMTIRAARGRRPAAAGRAWMELGRMQANAGHDAAALEMFSQGLQAAPEYPELLNMAAWLAATSEDPQARNPQQAVEWAQKAVEASKGKKAAYLSTLAEAYFASGQMIAAVRTLSIAIGLEPDEAAYRKQLERFQKASEVK